MFLLQAGCFAQTVENLAGTKEEENRDPNTWDFGQVKEGEVYKHVFIFKNEGAKLLTIKGITSSCGCTASEIKKKELPPGESTEVEVKFNSKGYSGPIKQFVYVNTDDVDNSVIRFIITADVK
jgi:hypothetical protein